jgi:hypothetical protein
MSNNRFLTIVSMLLRHARIVVLALLATTLPLSAFAASYGLDTPSGIGDMPFGVQGVQIMDLTAAGLTINSTSSGSSRATNLFINSANNNNQRLYIGINSNGGATSGDYASIEYVQDGQHWGGLALQADGGSVGIGTTNPSALFQIHNPGDNGDGIIISPDRDGDNTISIQSYIDSNVGGGVAGGAGYAGGCCNDLALNPEWGSVSVGGVSGNWANKFNVVGNSYFGGNVGIQTQSPAYPLDVNGIIRANASPNASWVGAVTASGGGGGSQAILAGQINNAYWTGVAGYASASNGIGVFGQGGLWAGSFAGPVDITSGYLQFPDGTQQTTAASTHAFGGMYSQVNGSGCYNANPFTGNCSCPAGYSASQMLAGSEGTGMNMYHTYCYK